MTTSSATISEALSSLPTSSFTPSRRLVLRKKFNHASPVLNDGGVSTPTTRRRHKPVKEAIMIEGRDENIKQSMSLSHQPVSPFLEQRSQTFSRWLSSSPSKALADLTVDDLEETSSDEPNDENLNDADESTSKKRKRKYTSHERLLEALDAAGGRERLDQAGFTKVWRESGRGGVSNEMIVAMGRWFAGGEIEEVEMGTGKKKMKVGTGMSVDDLED